MLPDEGLQITASDPSTMSFAETVKSTAAPLALVASNVMLPGRVRIGGVVSTTVIWNEPIPVLPAVSVAEHWTVVAPRAKTVPEVGLQETPSEPSTASLEEALKVTAVPSGPVASDVMALGR